jgi:2'-5' RNA ligase
MATFRTFIGVEASDEVRRRALGLMERLRVAPAKVKWTAAANLHWTMQFLGEVPHALVPDVCRQVIEAARPFAPFEVEAFGAGAFPSPSQPRVLWLGMREGEPAMVALHDAIEQALAPLGFQPERRRFHPHLTLGRVRGGLGLRELGDLLRRHAQYEAGWMTVSEVVVFSSTLDEDGPTYDALGRGPLAG